MKNRRLVLFDFCETLVDFQTADPFVDYVREHHSSYHIERRYRLYQFLHRCRFFHVTNRLLPHSSLGKKIYLFQLRGVSLQKLQELSLSYFKECIRPRLIPALIDRLQEHIRQGDRVWIISGGYEIYLTHFSDHFRVERVIATELEIHHGRATGCMREGDCMYEEKVRRLLKVLYNEEKNRPEIVAYSDSESDLPLLLFADKAVVVSKNESQIWAKERGFEEIIWK